LNPFYRPTLMERLYEAQYEAYQRALLFGPDSPGGLLGTALHILGFGERQRTEFHEMQNAWNQTHLPVNPNARARP
jgi:hypothetical protein